MRHRDPVIVGVAGGSGSGKTTVSRAILERVGQDRIAYIQHDSYYRDASHLPPEERAGINFDHPASLDTDLLVHHLRDLQAGVPVAVPVYDFADYTRSASTMRVEPHPIILVEGILIFAEPELRQLFDVKIFVDAEADVRFIRRLERDLRERGRTLESVIEQYLTTVKPMHEEFVEPSKRYADVIIPRGGRNQVALDLVIARVQSLLDDRST